MYVGSQEQGIINAILCGHNMILLGERGQGKSRIIRQMIDLLDEWMPAIEGCPINDDPFSPICSECKSKKEEMGDDLPIAYIGVGEAIEDLQDFDARRFVDALFD